MTLVNCSGPVPVLVTVMVLAELVAPCTSDPKFSDAGLIEAAGIVPVPESAMFWTAPALPESSLTVSVPLIVPVPPGVKLTATVQFDPGERAGGQLLVAPKPLLAVTEPMSNTLPPKLVMVTGAVAVVPRFWVIAREEGLKLIAEGRGLGKEIGTAP